MQPCLPCQAARRRGVGAMTVEQRRTAYGLLGGVAIVGLWGLSIWWLTR